MAINIIPLQEKMGNYDIRLTHSFNAMIIPLQEKIGKSYLDSLISVCAETSRAIINVVLIRSQHQQPGPRSGQRLSRLLLPCWRHSRGSRRRKWDKHQRSGPQNRYQSHRIESALRPSSGSVGERWSPPSPDGPVPRSPEGSQNVPPFRKARRDKAFRRCSQPKTRMYKFRDTCFPWKWSSPVTAEGTSPCGRWMSAQHCRTAALREEVRCDEGAGTGNQRP